MKVAAIQLKSTTDLQANLARASKLIQQARNEGAQMCVLPENFAYFNGPDYAQHAEKEGDFSGPIGQCLSECARTNSLWLVGGSIPCRPSSSESAAEKRVFTTCTVWSPEGALAAFYHKIHLFDVDLPNSKESYRESDFFIPGKSPTWVDTGAFKLGLSICYDLRFPEYFRLLRDQHVNLLTVPAAFTFQTGQAHWDVLLRARAIENQSYVIAANQVGLHTNGRQTWGHSCIIDPWGKVIAELPDDDEGIALAELDANYINEIRSKLPTQSHKVF